MRAAQISATFVPEGKHYRVLIRAAGRPRLSRTVPTERDARALAQHINALGTAEALGLLPGADLGQTLAAGPDREAASRVAYPPLREALPVFLTEMVALGEIRQSTAQAYRNRLTVWAFPALGDTPWNLVTREAIGKVLLAIRREGRSGACLEQIRCPLTRFYQWQINAKGYGGANPAADLKFFLGRQPSKRSRKRDVQWFRETEAQQLLAASREAYPRWYPFLVVSFGAGLRWGEATALHRTDIEWTRQRLHVQRTWSEDGGRFEACKDGEARRVAVAPAVLEALREHLANAELEGAVKRWDAEQRRLVFPNSRGRVTRYGTFMEHFWKPVLTLAGLPYRKPHAMRHSYATWQLEGGADLRWVKDQMGHASIEETEGTYGHLEPARHEHQGVEVLGRILKGAP